MCGVLLLHGPEAQRRLAACSRRLEHRGPDCTSNWIEGQTVIGFNRLAINDHGHTGQQPFLRGPYVAAINGEIYNHAELIERHDLSIDGCCDTSVVLPLFEFMGPGILDVLDGFYSGLIFDRRTKTLFCLRDHIGKKPLFVGRSGSEHFVTSELKALEEIDWFHSLPLGVAKVDLESGATELMGAHRKVPSPSSLRHLLEDAVGKRLPRADEPLGLFLSGGLDSSIVASLVARSRPDAVAYCLANEDSPDHGYARLVVDAFGLSNVRVLRPPGLDELPELIEKVVHATESFNPSIVSNGLCTYLLAKAAHEDGIKVVFTGDGADEFFGGYHHFKEEDPWRDTRGRLVDDLHFTELRRLDSCSMAHSVETRCPFLDRAVCSRADELPHDALYGSDRQQQNKVILRRSFEDVLPAEVANRKKASFDVGSGVRGAVVNYLRSCGRSEVNELEQVWRRLFRYDARNPHFHSYPVFDEAIAVRGATHR